MPEKRRRIVNIAAALCTLFALVVLCTWIAGERVQTPPVSTGGDTAASSAAVHKTGRVKEWTVFIYMCGTDLESEDGSASANLNEICRPRATEEINVVVQTGGTKNWRLNGIPEDRLARYEVDGERLHCMAQLPLASMGDGDTLSDFLRWGIETFPAEKYMLVLWNHGGGTLGGVCYDELFGSDSLELDEVADALDETDAMFEVIGFDACLMATLENAAAVSGYGRCMVASEEFEPGGGWNYADMLDYLSRNPDIGGVQLGRRICDGYYQKCIKSGSENMATLSVIDLAVVPELTQAFDEMAREMGGISGEIEQLQELTRRVRRAENYGGNSPGEGYTNMVDLGDLVAHTWEVLPQTGQAVLDALAGTVIHSVSGRQRDGAHGLSLFFPLNLNAQACEEYAGVCPSAHYLRFLEAIVPDFEAPADTPAPKLDAADAADYDVVLEADVDDAANFNLRIAEGFETVQSVKFWLFYVDYTYGEYVTMGMDNDVYSNWETGEFTDNFRGVWPTLNGYFCAPVLVDEGERYNIYSIPILLNGKQTNLRAAYIWDDADNGYYEVYGAWEGVDGDTGAVARKVRKLRDGDVVELIFTSVDWETGEELYYAMGSFTVDGEVRMEEQELMDGDYLYAYEVMDIFGRSHMSPFAVMSCSEDDIFVSME